jgi:ElaB/YqjD/DUF883 family membrane-anchored ribosome-binding protein
MRERAPTIDDEFASLKAEALSLLATTADADELRVVQARMRLVSALEHSAETWDQVQADVARRVRGRDKSLREDFYKTLGLAFGIGAYMAFIHLRRPPP